MKFSIYDYLLPSLLPYLLSVILVLGYVVFILNKHPKSSRLIWSGYIFTVGIMIAVLASIFPSVSHSGPLLSNAMRYEVIGVVENIRCAGKSHVYYDRTEGKLTNASYITISETDYYILSDSGIYVGQNLRLKYCPEGNAVVEWEVVPSGTSDLPQVHNEKITAQSKNTVSNISAEILIGLLGCIVLALRVFEGPIRKRRFAYIVSNEPARKGAVLPRRMSVIGCLTETIVTGFFCLSWITCNPTLIGFLGVLTGILWLLQLNIHKTAIWYEEGRFFLMTMGDTTLFQIEDVRSARMVPTRISGCMQLEVHFASGRVIRLNQLHFAGLDDFYKWLSLRN